MKKIVDKLKEQKSVNRWIYLALWVDFWLEVGISLGNRFWK